MDTPSLFEEKIKNSEFAKMIAQEDIILEVTEKIVELMQKENVTKTELAKRLGKSKGFITQLLNGNRNFTIRTIADIFYALGYTFRIVEEKYNHEQIQDNCNVMTKVVKLPIKR